MEKILIARTDRIGDVLLSTPAFRAVREAYPKSHIAVIVRPYAKDIVEGNPYIDEVILYDKDGIHKSIIGSLKFCLGLASRKFELAVILHPTNRMHIVTFLAGIPQRVGFNRKCGFLLTKKIVHTKQLGEKHEVDYTLDVIRAIGIEPSNRSLYFPLKRDAIKEMKRYLEDMGITENDRLVIIHPSASCPSKRWPARNFAELADRLISELGVKVAIISSPEEKIYARDMLERMKCQAFDLSGRTTVSQLGSLIKLSSLLISNDSGPVHIAASLSIPVIVIFGRRNRGLGPTRWRPLGDNSVVFHKDVGCQPCLAHNCDRAFKCLSAVSVGEVLKSAEKILMATDKQLLKSSKGRV